MVFSFVIYEPLVKPHMYFVDFFALYCSSIECIVIYKIYTFKWLQSLYIHIVVSCWYSFCLNSKFSNQTHSDWRPAHIWFLLKNFAVVSVCFCMYLSVCKFTLRLLITSGVILLDIKSIWLVKQILQVLYGSSSQYH